MAFVLSFTIILAATVRIASCQDPGLAWIWPPPVGFNLTTASVAPCGGFDTNHDGNLTYYLDQLRWNQTAAEITYMTRVSRNINASGDWDELYPTIEAAVDVANAANNAAQFCVPIPERSDPEQTNVFQLIANTPLGIVFACSKVKFARNADKAYANTCTPSIRGNSTVTNVTDQAILSAALLPAGSTATLPSSSSTEAATTGAASQVPPSLLPTSSGHISGGAIAGIVVGSLAGACAIAFFIVMMLMRKRQKPVAAIPKRNSVTSTSGSSNYDNVDIEKKSPSELPAVVPTELDSNARVELPTSEKDIRPELPTSEAGPLPKKTPIADEPPVSPTSENTVSHLYNHDHTLHSSPAVTAVSPTSTNRRHSQVSALSPVSPVSPMMSRADRHFP